MTSKALNKNDCEWWSNKINCTYDNFKTRVRQSISEKPIDEESRNRYYKKLVMDVIKDRKVGLDFDDIHVDEYYSGIEVTFKFDKDKVYTDAKRDKYMEERCHKIREICEPYQKKRDEFLVLIHSRPTQEDLGAMVEWCNELDGLYENKKECAL